MKQYALFVTLSLLIIGSIVYLRSNNTSVVAPTNFENASIVNVVETDKVNTATFTGKASNADVVAKKSVQQVTLNSANTVLLVGEIGSSALDVAQAITDHSDSGQPMFLLINSPGGSVLDGVAIVSAIQASKVPVYTVCLQLCASMASIIFEVGTKRLMVDRSFLMFHEAAGGIQGSFNQIKSRFRVFDRLVNKLYYEIAIRIGIDPDVFRSQLGNEIWLDAEDALKQNYADRLVNIHVAMGVNSANPNERLLKSQTEALFEKVKINLK